MSLVVQKYTPAVLGSDLSSERYRTSSTSYESETDLSAQFDRTKRLTGSNSAACATEAEYKADKLNRTEEVKLRNLKFQVAKAQEIKRRQYRHTENALRIKSASLVSKIKELEDSWSIGSSKTASRPRLLDKREFSDLGGSKCNTCVQLQNIIELYENESQNKGIVAKARTHSTCIFSNEQINSFLKMLEAKYIHEIPSVKVKLRDTGAASLFSQTKVGTPISKRQVELKLEFKDVQLRVRKFCGRLDHFNKEHGTVSKEIREKVEQIRISDAILKRQNIEGKKLNIREEVERMLNL